MNILVVCLHVIVCLVLIIVILLQAGRGQGLTGASFGGNVQSLFGTKASSFLTKATSFCAILFLFTCIGLNILEVKKSRSLYKAPSSQAALDVEQIKKALAKVNQADKATATASAAAVTDTAKSDTDKLAETVKDNFAAVAEEAKKP